MTIEKLEEIMAKHNIPKNVKIVSDSGLELYPTDMDGVWYNKNINLIIFTQEYHESYVKDLRNYGYEEDWKYWKYIGLKED